VERISNEQVRAQVQKFWRILSGKSRDSLEELYAPDALVFTGRAKRPEPAPLVAARRQRQLAGVSDSGVEVANMDVQIVSNVAVVSYTYQFHSAMTGNEGERMQKKTMFGRATQIFKIGENGMLQIVHEHLSAGEAPAVEKAQK
jgi:ketosteroid isomerase-like protein